MSSGDGARFGIASPFKRKSLEEGASIACDGCCLTVVDVGKAKDKARCFAVEASNETLARTTLGTWQEGRRINLERALTFGDELGGHLVTGHIDGRAESLPPHATATASDSCWRRLPTWRASSPRKARSRSTASRSRLTMSRASASA